MPFAKLTAAEIAQATRALTKPKTPAHAARAAYEKALAKHPAFAGVRVAEQAGRVTFSRVPLASVALFAGVIAKVKTDAGG